MLIDKDEMKMKFEEPKQDIEVMSEKPYFAIAHSGKHPAVIYFPRQSKAPNCSQHPGAHKARKNKCDHLSSHEKQFREEVSNNALASAPKETRAQARAQEAHENVIFKVQSKPAKDETEAVTNEREVNPYGQTWKKLQNVLKRKIQSLKNVLKIA